MGAYLGEVMIRRVGGHWRWDSEGRIPVIETEPGRLTFVLDKIYKRQVIGKEHNLDAFFQYFQGRVGFALIDVTHRPFRSERPNIDDPGFRSSG